MDWLIGAAGSGLIAGAAYSKGSLSGSGAAAAVLMGTLLYALGSPVWFVLMIVFFISSTLWTRFKHQKKRESEAFYQKTGRRDAGQVWANGGIGTVLCLIHFFRPEYNWPLAVYLGVMATVTADTWATELGGLNKSLPRSLITWRPVPKGTSGGVTSLGWIAAAAGGWLIGLLAVLLLAAENEAGVTGGRAVLLPELVALAGWVGANADSILGATVQTLYRCGVCSKEVESPIHCGTPSVHIRGWRWLDNDAVNMVSSLTGGLFGLVLWNLFM